MSVDVESDRCVGITAKNKRCVYDKVVGDLCTLHNNRKEKDDKMLVHDGLTKRCSEAEHYSYGSLYPKDKVPIEHFYKSNKPNSKLYNMCIDCRNAINLKTIKRKEKRIQMNNELQKIEPEYGVCCSIYHNIDVSIYPRDKVPSEMFDYKRKEGKSTECIECRKHHTQNHIKNTKISNEKAEKQGKIKCKRCRGEFKKEDMPIGKKGNTSKHCFACKELTRIYDAESANKRKQHLKSIKLEKIRSSGCSCQRCKKIFLTPLGYSLRQRELSTYEKDGERFVDYEGKTYLTKDFLIQFEDILELLNIDFDHLTEEEQRERGIIGPEESGIKKKASMAQIHTKDLMDEEAKITQNLCCLCHLKVTIERDTVKRIYPDWYIEKKAYVCRLKEKGCECCGFHGPSILSYLEFDHLDPKDKIACISLMMIRSNYTLEQLIEECKKCRILCRACHRIHTRLQKRQGLF